MATLTAPRKFRFASGSGSLRLYPEAATCVAKRGEPVNLTSGKVQRITTTTTSNLTSTDGVLGWAMTDASGTTDADIPILLADDLAEWLLPVVHSTAATAVTAITNIGAQYCLSHLNTGGWYGYEISQTSNPIIEISEIAKDYAVGEQYGWAWGKIINNARIIA